MENIQMKLLVVEDDEQVSGLLDRCLSNAGYGVDVAEDGDTAIRLAATREYGAIILDLMLPVRNGLEVAEDLDLDTRGEQVVEPTDVWVMAPTNHASTTLISCYPYLVNNKRIVIFADLAAPNPLF